MIRLLTLLIIFSTGCLKSKNYTPSGHAITVMTFNVENLFDAYDDKGKSDETYLPLSQKQSGTHKDKCRKHRFERWQNQCLNWDWNEKVVNAKLKKIADVIKFVRNGNGPHIVLLQEVENIRILRRLKNDFLKNLGYKEVVLIDGNDKRGIDVAILSKLKRVDRSLLKYVAFKKIEADRKADSRGILFTSFELPDTTPLSIFVGHFPAPFHPKELRMDSFEYLNKLYKKLPSDRLAIAGGDFNVPSREEKEHGIFKNFAQPIWWVSHLESCKKCEGTNYYPPQESWSFLDTLMASKNFENHPRWRIAKDSVRVIKGPDHVAEDGTPKRFEIEDLSGVSDHWPLALDIVPVSANK